MFQSNRPVFGHVFSYIFETTWDILIPQKVPDAKMYPLEHIRSDILVETCTLTYKQWQSQLQVLSTPIFNVFLCLWRGLSLWICIADNVSLRNFPTLMPGFKLKLFYVATVGKIPGKNKIFAPLTPTLFIQVIYTQNLCIWTYVNQLYIDYSEEWSPYISLINLII